MAIVKTTTIDDDDDNRIREVLDLTPDDTRADVEALVVAMWQLLDDMGKDGQGVCLASKAQARVVFEPFRDGEIETSNLMSLDDAKAIIDGARK